MENIALTRARLADILGLDEEALTAAEAGPLAALGGPRDRYDGEALSAYRAGLDIYPPERPLRRQLFLNFKGGTGKTSISVSYAYRLAEMGYQVLVIDLDSQGHATKCFGYEGEDQSHTLYDCLIKKQPISEVRLHSPLAELDLIPSNLQMATIDLALMPMAGREHKLRKALAEIEGDYDFVVMDAPPSFGLLNLNALMATDDLFVPVLPDFLSYHGLRLLFDTLDDISTDLDHRLERIFIVLNQFNPTTKIARAAREALESHYGEYLLKEPVRQCTKFAQASSEGVPIFVFDPSSKGAHDVQQLIDTTLPLPLNDLKERSA